jgi:cytochrome c553
MSTTSTLTVKPRRVARLAVSLIGLVLTAGSGFAAEPTPEDVRFFETKIRPLLVEKCVRCHGPEKQRGELRLDTVEGVRKGGDSGMALVPKERPETGTLMRAVRHEEGVAAMPPKGKLTAAEIADLAAWVARGAPFPATPKASGTDPTKHWAFQPVTAPVVPELRNPQSEIRTEIDRFILAKLSDKGLSPAPLADKRTLIRRATFDLTGLPPTPAEIDAFLADKSPDAFKKVVNRLLDSPAYGERWGRHWLDVARYADTNGLDENIAHGNAWRYRDYVVRSFNDDKPYDRFIAEQIAGDLIAKEEAAEGKRAADLLTATGFLSLGPKVLAEVDEKKMEFDLVDEQIDTLGKAVLGLTLGCARCHDHKFDPITTADYYGLAGIFVSTKTMDSFKKIARWHENTIASAEDVRRKTEHDAAVEKLKQKIKELQKKSPEAKDEARKLQEELTKLQAKAPELPSAMGVAEGTPTDVPVLRRGNHLTPGTVVQRGFPVVLRVSTSPAIAKDRSGRLELARWLTDPAHPLTARVIVNRVWRWHFGQGLVRSVDNFGLLAEKPVHPELLDFLAASFVKSGWSLKTLHRSIMLSAVYQRSSAHDAKAALADPDNRYHGRANIHRLEAEAIRDSLLAVSGLLDRTPGGPAITHVKNREFVFDHTSTDRTKYDSDRRSLYLPVVRNNLYDVFQLFDSPDPALPTGDRTTTTVPTQALFFMNSPLMVRAADALATRLLKEPGTDADRVRKLFALALGREASTKEVERLTAAAAAFESDFAKEEPANRRRKAWAAVCQAVLASNEFVHVR